MPPLDQLIQSIDARIQELNSDMVSLQAARSALVADAAAPTPRSAAKASRPTPHTRPWLTQEV